MELIFVLTNGQEINAGYVGPPKYTVTFMDWDGEVLKTENIIFGNSATPPSDPIREGYRFTGWDKSHIAVISELTITATYVQQFTVTFKDWNDEILKTQVVDCGGDATPPENPIRGGYTFTGWSGAYTNVVGNASITATYTENIALETHTVTFIDWDGTVLKSYEADEGLSAVPPTIATTARAGYYFAGWDVDFSTVTSAMNVNAVYVATTDSNIFLLSAEKSGNYVTVTLRLTGTVNFVGFNIDLIYDPDVLRVVEYDPDLSAYAPTTNHIQAQNLFKMVYTRENNATTARDIIEIKFEVIDGNAEFTIIDFFATQVIFIDGTPPSVPADHNFAGGVIYLK